MAYDAGIAVFAHSPDSGNPRLVSVTDRFALFTEVRERLGQAFVRTLSAGLPELADRIEVVADVAASALTRRERYASAAVLRIEAVPRAHRALGRLYDITFRLLEINQSRPDAEFPLSLVADEELDVRILADELAARIRERLGAPYEAWLHRVESLTLTRSIEVRAPLGAGAVAAAALAALHPVVTDRTMRPALREAIFERLAPRLADVLEQADAWLTARGVTPWLPEAVTQAPPSPGPPAGEAPVWAPASTTASMPGALAAADAARAAGPAVAPVPAAAAALLPAAAAEPEPEPPLPEAGPEPKGTAAESSEATAEPLAQAAAPTEDAWGAPIGPAPPDRRGAAPAEPVAGQVPDGRVAAPLPALREPPPGDGDGDDCVEVSSTGEAAMERAAQALVHSTQVADVLGRQPLGGPAPPEAAYRHAGSLPRPEALEQDAVAFAHHVGVSPYSRAARQRFFDSLRQRMLAAQAPAAQLAALDLVGAMFEYVVDDDRMPEAAKPLLWRMQQPAATLAALDAGYLGDDRRSVRRLVENLAAIAVAYADDVTKGSELYRRLDTVVRAVEVVSHAFQARSTVLGEQVRREYDRAAHGVAQLVARVAKERLALEATPDRRNRRDFSRRPSREREREVTRRLEAELVDRVGQAEVPDSVREFLLGVWLRHLRTAVLRDGQDSAAYRLAMQVVDDLLWTLSKAEPRQSRRQLASRIPPLIRLLTQGVNDIGARPEEFRSFLDELFLIHLRKMQKVPRDGEGESPAASGTSAPPSSPGAGGGASFDEGMPPTLDDRITEASTGTASDAGGPSDAAAANRNRGADRRTVDRPPSAPVGLDALAEQALRTAAAHAPPSEATQAPAVGPAAAPAAPAVSPAAPAESAESSKPAEPAEPAAVTPDASAPPLRPDAPPTTGRPPAVWADAAWPGDPMPPMVDAAALSNWPLSRAGPPTHDFGIADFAPADGAPDGTAQPPRAPHGDDATLDAAAPDGAHADGDRAASESGDPPAHSAAPRIGLAPRSGADGANGASGSDGSDPPGGDSRSGEQRLLTVLSSLDLGDFPDDPQRLRLDPDEALARLRRGDWLELIGRDGLPQEVKVAWINSRRTVVLLVRRPDRRALSLRASELHQRFAQRKATLLV
jgi:hypothetical protein